MNVFPLGPHGGKLTVDLSPGSRIYADRAARQEMSQAISQLAQKVSSSSSFCREETRQGHYDQPWIDLQQNI
ncbi:MAG: hypothetical protein AAF383_23050 [Cyanobacteria bacterium P01_A01_bin.83]